MKTYWVLAIFTLMSFTVTAQEVEFLTSKAVEDLNLPFSEATRVGNLLFLSGQLGNVPGKLLLIEGGIEAETEQAMNNIKAALARHGSDLRQVAKCLVFLVDLSDYPAMNEVYKKFIPPPYPARSVVQVGNLALGARLEIECIAVSAN